MSSACPKCHATSMYYCAYGPTECPYQIEAAADDAEDEAKTAAALHDPDAFAAWFADNLVAPMHRAIDDLLKHGEYVMLANSDGTWQHVPLDSLEIALKAEGIDTVIVRGGSRMGKTAALEDAIERMVKVEAISTPESPDYLQHDPTKNHRRRRAAKVTGLRCRPRW